MHEHLLEPLNCGAHPEASTKRFLSAYRAFEQDLCGQSTGCHRVFELLLDVACDLRLRPATILITALGLFSVIVVVLGSFLARFLRWSAAKRESAFVAVATAAIKELREHHPAAYPSASHSWLALNKDSNAPVVCCLCFKPVIGAIEGQCCEYCGVVVHHRCVRKVPHDCKPLAVHGGCLLHDWKPAGVVLPLVQDELVAEVSTAELCLYCHEPCEVGLFAAEPVWTCSWCHLLCHVRCFIGQHPDHFTAETKAAVALQAAVVPHDMFSKQDRSSSFTMPCGRPLTQGMMGIGNGNGNGASGYCTRDAVWAHDNVVQQQQQQQQEAGSRGRKSRPSSAKATASTSPSGRLGAAALSLTQSDAMQQQPKHKRKALKGSSQSNHAHKAETYNGASKHAVSNSRAGGAHHVAAKKKQWLDEEQWGRHSDVGSYGRPGWGSSSGGRGRDIASTGGASQDAEPDEFMDPEGGSPRGHRRCWSLPELAKAEQAQQQQGRTLPGSGAHTPQPSHPSSAGHLDAESVASPLGYSAFLSRFGAQHAALAQGLIDLDLCQLGAVGKIVLPSTAVVQLRGSPSSTPSSSLSGVKTPIAGKTGSPGVSSTSDKHQQQASLHPSHTSASLLGAVMDAATAAVVGHSRQVAVGSSGSSRKKSKAAGKLLDSGKHWWRQRHPLVKWKDYRIDVDALPAGYKPLLAFINIKSGGQFGANLKHQLLQLLHPLQVVELPKEKPEAALRCFALVPNLRILVLGGDGTVGWILSALDELRLWLESMGIEVWRQPPIAILPMGTGNDLARCLNWGGGLSEVRQRGLATVLSEVVQSTPILLDRWNLTLTPLVQQRKHTLKRFMHRSKSSRQLVALEPKRQALKVLNNYLGIGVDAKVALEFHKMRESYPSWFQSQVGNKMWYSGVGLQDLVRRSCCNIGKRLTVLCDGVELHVPADAEGIIFLNIGSHMGGVFQWENGLPAPPIPGGEAVTTYRRQLMSDGLLEVVAIGGVLHMGRLAVGLSRAQRLAQGSRIVIRTHEDLPMQVDGEPWMQGPAELVISLGDTRGTMLKRITPSPMAHVASTVQDVLDSSTRQGIITEQQRQAITAELLLRLEPLL